MIYAIRHWWLRLSYPVKVVIGYCPELTMTKTIMSDKRRDYRFSGLNNGRKTHAWLPSPSHEGFWRSLCGYAYHEDHLTGDSEKNTPCSLCKAAAHRRAEGKIMKAWIEYHPEDGLVLRDEPPGDRPHMPAKWYVEIDIPISEFELYTAIYATMSRMERRLGEYFRSAGGEY